MSDPEKSVPPSNGDIEHEKRDPEKYSSDAEHKNHIDQNDHSKEASDFVYPTPKEEAAVIRKLDFHIMPIVFILYMLSVLDRANLGNARLAGMEDGEL